MIFFINYFKLPRKNQLRKSDILCTFFRWAAHVATLFKQGTVCALQNHQIQYFYDNLIIKTGSCPKNLNNSDGHCLIKFQEINERLQPTRSNSMIISWNQIFKSWLYRWRYIERLTSKIKGRYVKLYRKVYRKTIETAKDIYYNTRLAKTGNIVKETWSIVNVLRNKTSAATCNTYYTWGPSLLLPLMINFNISMMQMSMGIILSTRLW